MYIHNVHTHCTYTLYNVHCTMYKHINVQTYHMAKRVPQSSGSQARTDLSIFRQGVEGLVRGVGEKYDFFETHSIACDFGTF